MPSYGQFHHYCWCGRDVRVSAPPPIISLALFTSNGARASFERHRKHTKQTHKQKPNKHTGSPHPQPRMVPWRQTKFPQWSSSPLVHKPSCPRKYLPLPHYSHPLRGKRHNTHVAGAVPADWSAITVAESFLPCPPLGLFISLI